MPYAHRSHRLFVLLGTALVWAVTLVPATAQTGGGQPQISARGFVDLGFQRFAANNSFDTILGTSGGMIFGGGAQVALWNGLFFEFGVSRFNDTGRRVFIFNNDIFDLGIATEVTVTPIDITGGYRFSGFDPLTPYLGAGIGFYRYEETFAFAVASESVNERHTGFHIMGGAEVGVHEWVAIAGDVRWASVPDGLGAGGVSQHFNETDLGGASVRVLFGR